MPGTILLIDDSTTIREIIKIYLMGGGYEFLEAENGERGLQVLELAPVQLVIADIKMPVVDGLTFVTRLRAHGNDQLRSLPVILLTGEKGENLQARGMEAGASAFLQKPVSSAKLKSLVSQFLG